MNIFTSLLLAFGVAMDAFAVAVASGSVAGKFRWTEAFKVALLFGIFQAVMPVIGWLVGVSFRETIQSFDHWLAFALLGIIGSKMIYDDLSATGEHEELGAAKSSGIGSLLLLAVATSIDAMAVGFSLTFLNSILMPVLIIGLVTFGLSFVGVYLGHRSRRFGQNKARLVGGLVLIVIGAKILYEHLSQIN